jgi:hypothetical protein
MILLAGEALPMVWISAGHVQSVQEVLLWG